MKLFWAIMEDDSVRGPFVHLRDALNYNFAGARIVSVDVADWTTQLAQRG